MTMTEATATLTAEDYARFAKYCCEDLERDSEVILRKFAQRYGLNIVTDRKSRVGSIIFYKNTRVLEYNPTKPAKPFGEQPVLELFHAFARPGSNLCPNVSTRYVGVHCQNRDFGLAKIELARFVLHLESLGAVAVQSFGYATGMPQHGDSKRYAVKITPTVKPPEPLVMPSFEEIVKARRVCKEAEQAADRVVEEMKKIAVEHDGLEFKLAEPTIENGGIVEGFTPAPVDTGGAIEAIINVGKSRREPIPISFEGSVEQFAKLHARMFGQPTTKEQNEMFEHTIEPQNELTFGEMKTASDAPLTAQPLSNPSPTPKNASEAPQTQKTAYRNEQVESLKAMFRNLNKHIDEIKVEVGVNRQTELVVHETEKAEILTMTPDDCALALLRNKNFRTLMAAHIRNLAQDIKNDAYDLNGETMKFDEYDNLIDGQNRAAACILADKPIRTFVALGIKSDRNVDTGVGRTLGQYLNSIGFNDSVAAAAVLRCIYSYSVTSRPITIGRKWTNETLLEFLATLNKDLFVWAVTTARSQKLAPPSLYGCLLYFFAIRSKAQAEFFAQKFADGEGLQRGNPMLTLRERLTTLRLSKVAKNKNMNVSPEVGAYIVKAWNAYRKGKTITKLTFVDDEPFPHIV